MPSNSSAKSIVRKKPLFKKAKAGVSGTSAGEPAPADRGSGGERQHVTPKQSRDQAELVIRRKRKRSVDLGWSAGRHQSSSGLTPTAITPRHPSPATTPHQEPCPKPARAQTDQTKLATSPFMPQLPATPPHVQQPPSSVGPGHTPNLSAMAPHPLPPPAASQDTIASPELKKPKVSKSTSLTHHHSPAPSPPIHFTSNLRSAAAISSPEVSTGAQGLTPSASLDVSGCTVRGSRPLCECCRSPLVGGAAEGGRAEGGVEATGATSEALCVYSGDPGSHFEEELLLGVCPEDLSFTLNTSDNTGVPATSRAEIGPARVCEGAASDLKEQTELTRVTLSGAAIDGGRDPSVGVGPAGRQGTGVRVTVQEGSPVAGVTGYPYSGPAQGVDSAGKGGLEFGQPGSHGNQNVKVPGSSTPHQVAMVSGSGAGTRLHSYPQGTFYGLPMDVQLCLEESRGISKLYDWQDTCLRLRSVVEGRSLIYSLPTSGGKTLVAEILILRQLLIQRRDVIFVLPFVSIVQEKVRDLLPFASRLGFAVEEYASSKGRLPPRKRRRKNVVYIATIEKASGLVDSLIELKRVSSLGLVVVDELHMLGEGGVRGATLETCLAKVLFTCPATQLVGMSATLSNMQDLAAFLRADVFSSDFRPVELREYVKIDRCVYSVEVNRGKVNFLPDRDIMDLSPDSSLADPDQLVSLVSEVIPHSSCLLFCPTKKNCQNVALLLVSLLPRSLKEIKRDRRKALLKLLSVEAAGVCPVLARTIPYGVAYHHSGLTTDERRLIEEAYLEETLCLLVCTSTLAAGVNLPAKRVILRSPYVGTQCLSRSQYKQMVGRAGRTGMCTSGESILIVHHQERQRVVGLLSGPYDRCTSSLLSPRGTTAMYSLILTLIGLELVSSSQELHHFLRHTLLSTQTDQDHLNKSCDHILSRLVTMEYITMETNSTPSTFLITPLGRATYKGSLPVETAHVTYQELVGAQHCLVLSTDLHLLFLATPPDVATSIQPQWMVYFQTLTCQGPDELKVAELVGISPAFLSKKATGLAPKMSESTVTLYHRFYLSLMLHHLLRANSSEGVWSVAERFHCSRGYLQNLINSTAAFASCLVRFTEELPEMWSLHLLFPSITKLLTFTASVDLVSLMEIPGVKQGRARQLLAAGIRTAQDLASADPSDLCEKIEHIFPKNATRLIQAAKAVLSDQAEALFEEAEELLTLAPLPAIS